MSKFVHVPLERFEKLFPDVQLGKAYSFEYRFSDGYEHYNESGVFDSWEELRTGVIADYNRHFNELEDKIPTTAPRDNEEVYVENRTGDKTLFLELCCFYIKD